MRLDEAKHDGVKIIALSFSNTEVITEKLFLSLENAVFDLSVTSDA